MNDLNARSVRHQGQFVGQFRRVHKAEWETVCENGEPKLFDTAEKAECAAWRVLRVHMGEVLGYREVSPRERAEAELARVFGHGKAEEKAEG